MKTMRALLAVLLLMGILGLSLAPVLAYEVAYVRLTGTLLPLEEGGQRGIRETLNVRINGKVWIFQLAKVENLMDSRNGRVILQKVFPARISFTAAEDLAHNLREPEIAGKPITITGFLYLVSRVLFVTAVDKAKKTPTN